jgi:hypothetical protein
VARAGAQGAFLMPDGRRATGAHSGDAHTVVLRPLATDASGHRAPNQAQAEGCAPRATSRGAAGAQALPDAASLGKVASEDAVDRRPRQARRAGDRRDRNVELVRGAYQRRKISRQTEGLRSGAITLEAEPAHLVEQLVGVLGGHMWNVLDTDSAVNYVTVAPAKSPGGGGTPRGMAQEVEAPMHDHRTGPDGAHEDAITRHSARLVADLEAWLADPDDEPPTSWSAPSTADPAQAAHAAWSVVADAYERALTVAGLAEDDAVWLARNYRGAARQAGREAIPELAARSQTAATRARLDWFDRHAHIASEPGGILGWTDLPDDIRHTLYGERVFTINKVRELARDHELTAVAGIGPARARRIMQALRQFDDQGVQ